MLASIVQSNLAGIPKEGEEDPKSKTRDTKGPTGITLPIGHSSGYTNISKPNVQANSTVNGKQAEMAQEMEQICQNVYRQVVLSQDVTPYVKTSNGGWQPHVAFRDIVIDTNSHTLIVSFQVMEIDDPDYTQLILGRTWQKGARAIINMDKEVVHIRMGASTLTMVKMIGMGQTGVIKVQRAQLVNWDFTSGFFDKDEDQFLVDQPWIIPVAEVNLVPLTDKEKQKELKKYLQSVKRKIKLRVPPQIATHQEVGLELKEE
ncbi:hypothetical protein R1flu_020190 [Riccia fluitans]|uniref:Uncharacterized protein n=1 Tax=Riccia fluitans TaxID=41844 RepID=A0ABD1ZL96_9MARC